MNYYESRKTMATNKKKRTTILLGIIVIGSGFALTLGLSFGRKTDTSAPKKPPLVSVTATRTQDFPIEFTAQGHLVSLNQVDVRPQLTGTIQSVNFKEGDEIRAGQMLFTLDASDATAQLKRFEAQAAQIEAQLADAKRDHNRAQELVKSNFIAPSAVDTAASKADALQAQLKAARAEVDSARVVLAHTRITAPISAKAGAVTVHPGSLAQINATAPLVTLAQFDPIGVEFSLPEQNLNPILAARATAPVIVSIVSPDGKTIEGKLSFINYTVNTDTGTINLKATFPNQQRNLWPGTFARVTVRAGFSKGAVVLPPQAVLEGPNGRFVYAVDGDSKVIPKPVTLLRVQNEMAVIDGLTSGERVVLEGAQNLRSGMLVQVTDRSAPRNAPGGPAGADAMASKAGK
jgi:RND family efflux transporter MFP subunit